MSRQPSVSVTLHDGVPPRVAKVLAANALVLILLSLCSVAASRLGTYGPGGRFALDFFNVDREQNLPTWYSATILAVAGLLSILLPHTASNVAAQTRRWYWLVLGSTMLLMSLDEYAELHERTSHMLQRHLHSEGLLHFAWVIPGAILVLGFGGFMIPFLRSIPPRTRNLLLAAGFMYVSGALGMELVEGAFASRYGQKALAFDLMATVEELLEISGVSVMIFALTDALRARNSVDAHAAGPQMVAAGEEFFAAQAKDGAR